MEPTAAASAAASAAGPRVARALAALLTFIVLVPLLAMVAVLAWFADAGTTTPVAPEIGPATGIPPEYVPLYNEAGRAFAVNPFLLAAIHKHETGFSTNPDTFRIN